MSTGFSDLATALGDGGPNKLYHNNGNGTFTDVAKQLNVVEPAVSFPVWFWDFNNDGALDLYVSCSSGPVGVLASDHRFGLNCLYRGDGMGGFTEVSSQSKLNYPAQPMGANFGDLNNDGFLDFYLATGNIQFSEIRPNVMFLSRAGQEFDNVTYAGGFGHLQKGHGVCFADLDNDGDQDVYVQMGGAWPGDKFNDALFENPGFGNHWISVKLQGRKSNRSAIGTRIRIVISENGQKRSIYRWVNSGGSFGANPLRQQIGLGTAEKMELLEIYWPATDITQRFENVSADQFIKIREGDDRYQTIPTKRMRFATKQG